MSTPIPLRQEDALSHSSTTVPPDMADEISRWLAQTLLEERQALHATLERSQAQTGQALRAALEKSQQESLEALDAEIARRHQVLAAGLRSQPSSAPQRGGAGGVAGFLPGMLPEAVSPAKVSHGKIPMPAKLPPGKIPMNDEGEDDKIGRSSSAPSGRAETADSVVPVTPQADRPSQASLVSREKEPYEQQPEAQDEDVSPDKKPPTSLAVPLTPRKNKRKSAMMLDDMELRVSRLLFNGRKKTTRRRWARYVEDARFEMFIGLMIMLNGLQMAIEVQYQGLLRGSELEYRSYRSDPWSGSQPILDAFGYFFGVVFTIEVAMKLVALQCDFIKSGWNLFDLTVVIFFLVEAMAMGDENLKQTTFFRVARLVRLLRLVRVVRQIRSFDALFLMTTAIRSSAIVLAWSCILLLMIQVLFAFCINQTLELFYFTEDHPLQEKQVVFEYFGSFSRALLSTFEMTLANWPPVCRVLMEYVNEWFMVLCLFHKLTVGFAVIGIINGVFIQETFRVASQDDFIMMHQKENASRTHMRKMHRLFEAGDTTGDGQLDKREFLSLMDNMEVKTWLASMGLDAADADALFEFMDKDRNHNVDVDELIEGVSKLKGAARSLDLLICLHKQHDLYEFLEEVHPEIARRRRESRAGPMKTHLWDSSVKRNASKPKDREQPTMLTSPLGKSDGFTDGASVDVF